MKQIIEEKLLNCNKIDIDIIETILLECNFNQYDYNNALEDIQSIAKNINKELPVEFFIESIEE